MLISKSFSKLNDNIFLIFLEETGHVSKFSIFILGFNVDNKFFVVDRDGVTFLLFSFKDHNQELKNILDTVLNYISVQVTSVEKWCRFSIFWVVAFVKFIKRGSIEIEFRKNFFWNFSELNSIVNHVIRTFSTFEFRLLFFFLLLGLNFFKSVLELLLDFL